MTTFLLCHGAWGAGWAWTDVARIIRNQGHDVFVPTYTGLGERFHLATPEVNLSTHAADVEGVIRWERLDEFVLVGHSYGGMVITAIAERHWQKIPKIVYLDAFLPGDGQALFDLIPPEVSQGMRKLAQEGGDGWRIPRPPGSLSTRFTEAEKEWHLELGCPHPLACMTEPVKTSGNHLKIKNKVYVLCADDKKSPFHQFAAWTREQSDWQTIDLPTEHHLQNLMPRETADIIMDGFN